MNPTLLPPAMSKIVGQIEFYSLGLATSLGERKWKWQVEFLVEVVCVHFALIPLVKA